jgi:gephyrin
MISVDEALTIIDHHTEILAVEEKEVDFGVVGRVLVENIHAVEAVPGYPASIVDGYAIRGGCDSSCLFKVPNLA